MGYLKALFDGLVKLRINDVGDTKTMLSKENEEVEFQRPVKATKDAEQWLNKIQDEMKDTLKRKLKDGNKAYMDPKTSRKEWVLKHPGQVVATAAMIQWCYQTEEAIQAQTDDPEALQNFFQQNDDQLKALTFLVCGKLEDLQRAIIVALITQDVHARDIIDELRKDQVCNIFDFNW